jgi:hypothetical protein
MTTAWPAQTGPIPAEPRNVDEILNARRSVLQFQDELCEQWLGKNELLRMQVQDMTIMEAAMLSRSHRSPEAD